MRQNITKMVKIDALNEQIITLLERDARQSSDILAKKLGRSPATIRRRIRNLIKSDAIRIKAVVNDQTIAPAVAAVIAFDAVPDKLELVMETLSKLPEVTWVSSCTGRFDIIALARFRSNDELTEFVQGQLLRLEGIRNTETFLCLQQKKTAFTTLE